MKSNRQTLEKTEYDTETKSLVVEFNNGHRYEYESVPHQSYTAFRTVPIPRKVFYHRYLKEVQVQETVVFIKDE